MFLYMKMLLLYGKNASVLYSTPHGPDLAHGNFWLSPSVKMELTDHHFSSNESCEKFQMANSYWTGFYVYNMTEAMEAVYLKVVGLFLKRTMYNLFFK